MKYDRLRVCIKKRECDHLSWYPFTAYPLSPFRRQPALCSFPLLSVAGHNSPHATSQERTTECYRARPRLRPSPLPPASTNPPRPLAHSRSSSPYLTSSACPSILRRPACSRPSPFVRVCVSASSFPLRHFLLLPPVCLQSSPHACEGTPRRSTAAARQWRHAPSRF